MRKRNKPTLVEWTALACLISFLAFALGFGCGASWQRDYGKVMEVKP